MRVNRFTGYGSCGLIVLSTSLQSTFIQGAPRGTLRRNKQENGKIDRGEEGKRERERENKRERTRVGIEDNGSVNDIFCWC